MEPAAKLLLLLTAVSIPAIAQSSLYGEQIRQYFHNIYSPPLQNRGLSRRNLPPVTGNAVFQEPSSRDLDVGFAVGVKDEGEANDILINNHSSKTYSPQEQVEQSYVVHEPSSTSKELNIGVFVDPKNGVTYYAPSSVPSPRPSVYESLPGGSFAQGSNQNYQTFIPNPQSSFPNYYQQILPPYPIVTSASNYANRLPEQYPSANVFPSQYQSASNYVNRLPEQYPSANVFPFQYQTPPKQIIGSLPGQNYLGNSLSRFSSTDQLPSTPYPYQSPVVDEFSRPYFSKQIPFPSAQIPELIYRQPFTPGVFDVGGYPENYQGRFARSYGRSPYGFPGQLKNLQDVFQIEEQPPSGPFGRFARPVVARKEVQVPEIIVNQQGIPIMSSQPYGERQVGAFKLRNDRGYQVTMNVPPIPADGPADGVLVMEMKANLYRPLS